MTAMIALVVLGPSGLKLAEILKGVLPDAEVHGLEGRVKDADVFFSDTGAHLRALFAQSRPIVGVMASGILIRSLAPELSDKKTEPPVVAVADDGSVAVPLLGGHHGANELARLIAGALGGQAAVTTAGDVAFGLALDNPPPGWRVANPTAAKKITARLLAGDPVALVVDAGNADWITETDAVFVEDAPASVIVTDCAVAKPGKNLVLHPPVLALGVGCERGATAEELIGLAEQTLADAGLSAASVALVASLDLKADEAAVHALAAHLSVSARFFPAEELEWQTPRLANPSDVVFAEVGCHGVCEGAALAAVGRQGALVAEKQKSKRATCAIACSPEIIDPESVGAARGRLTVVGIGPGSAEWRTPEVTAVLRQASDIVGYGLYLDLIEDLTAGKNLHSSDLGKEEDRARKALDLAALGRDVALVSSGDAGIYALATLAFELLDRENRPEWNRLEVSVAPGISALQAAAARIGAPLGHDFCAISLSDLLTPIEDIERRLRAAAAGDFVVALYNPVSKRRKKQLAMARDILLTARPEATPVILARNLGRDGETVDVITLGDLTVDMVDMLTLVMIGSSQTRVIKGSPPRVYTPRGYDPKKEVSE
ncbi:MAG: precorrin-3B C(17)-methyltransferase [Proteobacteria bacterium]|nr:precorrin-3B C(17)-methyltransferase [Pseudomonadota bacterium]MDA1022043.1 precorrin-3B C(17)-methyltransferase [Pseudomonadota bacterium]